MDVRVFNDIGDCRLRAQVWLICYSKAQIERHGHAIEFGSRMEGERALAEQIYGFRQQELAQKVLGRVNRSIGFSWKMYVNSAGASTGKCVSAVAS